MNSIRVMSIPDLVRAKEEIDKEEHIIIQIQHTGENECNRVLFSNTISNITFDFDDVNKGDENFISHASIDWVRVIVDNIHEGELNQKYPIYVCCAGGLSRSPAVAMAIMYLLISKYNMNEYKEMLSVFTVMYPHFNSDIYNSIIEDDIDDDI